MLTRRQFLTRLAQAGVIVATPKLIQKVLPTPAKPEIMLESTAKGISDFRGGVLTPQMLEEAYQSIVFGYDEPDLIIVQDRRTYDILCKLCKDKRYGDLFEGEAFQATEIVSWPKYQAAQIQ